MAVLVIGAGLAGLRTVESLRRNGYDGRVVLVGAEGDPPYDRPPLSKAMFADEESPRPLLPAEQLAGLRAEIVLGTPVVGLDVERRCATLRDGTEIGYEHAVIAVGATARRLPGLGGAPTLRTARDRDLVRSAVARSGSLVVVGAGFLGLEVAASARASGAVVTVVEPQPMPLAGVVGPAVGAEIARLHRDQGVDLRCGISVAGLTSAAGAWTCTLGDGEEIVAGASLVAVGSALDLAWLDGSGVKVESGVLCDEFGRTSVDSVWAVGDCSSWWEPARDGYVRREHWTHASDQGEAVGRTIATSELTAVAGPAYFWSDQFGVKVQALGDPAPDELTETRLVGADRRLFAVYSVDGSATAVVGFGLPRQVMRSRGLIGGPVGDVLGLLD